MNQHEEVEGEEILITWIITGYSPKRRDRLQSIIQILRRAGSISLSRARHSPGNDQEPDGKDERHFVRHFGGRHHRFTSRRTRKLSSSGVSVACYSYARLMINRRSHADKRSLDLSFSLSLSLNDFNAGSRSIPRSVPRSWFSIDWMLGNLTRTGFCNRSVSVPEERFSELDSSGIFGVKMISCVKSSSSSSFFFFLFFLICDIFF